MDPLELAWLEFREAPDIGGGRFAAVALPLVEAALPRDLRDPHYPRTAATDAILELIEQPDRYDPTRLPLFKYLRMAARRDLLNLWERERKHQTGRDPGDPVELLASVGKVEQEAPDLLDNHPALTVAIAELAKEDQAVLALMRQGERATTMFAVALSLGERPPAELAAEVKRAKDRIIARLKRAGRTA